MTSKKGGPRTAEGRARAARNAIRHGLSAGKSAQGSSYEALDEILAKALDAEENILRVVEQSLASLPESDTPLDMDAVDKNLKALIAVERYVGRSFTKRHSLVRKDRDGGKRT